ncbi:MAG: helix-turn-helix transcriptional regulator [Bdellovibrionaceae bacterium]|jgi:predicted transcriptional regulator|nr:helix-turn-helix transcriptional regulator [Bdellovibrionales bacterium]MCB9254149.1 helix-turn-helix transcriptional regulator [Pseudobdellovibrionaceae bacterium]
MRLKLAQIMEKRKISKYRLAQMLGVPTASVFRYFKPGYDPKLSTLENIAKVLGIKVRDLLDE